MFNRRVFIFLALVGATLAVFLGRLAQLQLVRGDLYAQRVEESMQRSRMLATRRGKIVDRYGWPLALDQACYDFCLDYRALAVWWAQRQVGYELTFDWLATNDEATRRRLGQAVEARDDMVEDWASIRQWVRRQARKIAAEENIELPDGMGRAVGRFMERLNGSIDQASRVSLVPRAEIERKADAVLRQVRAIRRIVGTRVGEELLAHAVVTGLDLPTITVLHSGMDELVGASDRPSTQRWYPYGALACHVIGLVGEVAPSEQEADPATRDDKLRRYLDGELIGKAGVEKMCEPLLRGTRGLEVTDRRDPGRQSQYVAPVPGRDVTLTLDIRLQEALTGLLAESSPAANGSAVVIDVPTGDILAMVSLPTYDLNHYRRDLPAMVQDGTNFPLMHRAVAGGYPPGSTVKPITGLAAVAAGAIGTHGTVNCRGYLDSPESRSFRCWRTFGHGEVDLERSLVESCNVYCYVVGQRLGVGRLTDWMRQFGLGEPLGTGLPEEKVGLVPTARWLFERRGRHFTPGDACNMAIGQGPLLATPLQVANVAATIARDGLFLSPRIVLDGGPEQIIRDLHLPGDALAAVQRGMYGVVNASAGTAHNTARHPTIEICGKTGTAQTSPLWVDHNGDGRVQSAELIRGDTAWFVGYAPYRAPKVAFVIIKEYVHEGGGRACGPLARDLVELCREHGYLRP